MNKLLELLKRKPRENLVEKTPEDVYANVAEEIPEYSKEDIAKIGGVESQHGELNNNLQGGSSKGLFQFMPRTAEAIRPGSKSSVSDINTQEDLMKDYLRENTDKIKNVKGSSSIEDAYAYHNLGPGMGKVFMKADDNQPLSAILPENVIKSNPKLYNYKTVGQAKAAMRKFLNERGDQANFAPDIQDLFKKEE